MKKQSRRQPALALRAPDFIERNCDPRAIAIIKTFQYRGHPAYLAGGCVRDMLLNRLPKDYDIATNADVATITSLFPGSFVAGKSFGVVRVPMNGTEFEVAMFRSDGKYLDGRHPSSVAPALPWVDACRRDFTVNALFCDPVDHVIFDYVGGIKDIKRRKIRAVGDPSERFAEDHLRLLRAVRFATTLDFQLDKTTREAIPPLANSLTKIATERIRDEFCRILVESQRPGDAVLMLHALGILRILLPDADAMQKQEQPPDYHPEGDVLTHTVGMLNMMTTRNLKLALAVLLHDVGKPKTAAKIDDRIRFHLHADIGAEIAGDFLRKLKMPSGDVDTICQLVRGHSRLAHASKMSMSTLRRLVGEPTFPLALELHRLDCESSNRHMANYAFLRDLVDKFACEPALPREWITGTDILAMGINEGPEIGRLKQMAYDCQLEGSFPSRDALLKWLQTEIKSPSI